MSNAHTLTPEALVRELRASIVAAPSFGRLTSEQRRDMDRDLAELVRLLSDDAARSRALADESAGLEVPDASDPTDVAPNTNIQRDTSTAFGQLVEQVDFVGFVSKLMHGVFDAIVQSSESQMQAYAKMLEGVVMSTKDFAETSISDTDARSHLLSSFASLMDLGSDGNSIIPKDGMDGRASQMFGGLSDWTSPATQTALVTRAKLQLAQQRQQLLATMVVMGINRIVVTDGNINAKVQFHIHTDSTAEVETGAAALGANARPEGERTTQISTGHDSSYTPVVVSGYDNFQAYNYPLRPGWYIVDVDPNVPYGVGHRGDYPVLHLPAWGVRAIKIPQGWSVQFQQAAYMTAGNIPSIDDRNPRVTMTGPKVYSTGATLPMFQRINWVVVRGPAFRTDGFHVRLSTTNKDPSSMNKAEMTTAATMKGEVDINFQSQTFPLGKLGPELMGVVEHKAASEHGNTGSSASKLRPGSGGSDVAAGPSV